MSYESVNCSMPSATSTCRSPDRLRPSA